MDIRILVKNKEGTYIGEFSRFRNLKFGKRLNNYGTCTFDIPVNRPELNKLISLRNYEIEIYLCETNTVQTLIWAGEQASRLANLTDTGDDWATITCYTFLEMLNHRFTVAERIFVIEDEMDSGDIAWTLIDETQADDYGDLGFTQGDIEATIIREVKYYNQNIMNAIIDLANMTYGFDFDINDEKEFNVWAIKGVNRSDDIQLILGKNVKSAVITDDFTNPGNRALILGTDLTDSSLLRVERNNANSQSAIKLREYIDSQADISDEDSLEYLGDAILRKYKQPVLSISVTLVANAGLYPKDFSVGDTVKVRIKKGIYDFNIQMRIHEWDFSLGGDKKEYLGLVLSIL